MKTLGLFRIVEVENGLLLQTKRAENDHWSTRIIPEGVTPGEAINAWMTTAKLEAQASPTTPGKKVPWRPAAATPKPDPDDFDE